MPARLGGQKTIGGRFANRSLASSRIELTTEETAVATNITAMMAAISVNVMNIIIVIPSAIRRIVVWKILSHNAQPAAVSRETRAGPLQLMPNAVIKLQPH